MADDARVRIQMVDGRHLEAILVNRDHVLWLERRGQTRTSLVR
jgi:hypothetical protein